MPDALTVGLNYYENGKNDMGARAEEWVNTKIAGGRESKAEVPEALRDRVPGLRRYLARGAASSGLAGDFLYPGSDGFSVFVSACGFPLRDFCYATTSWRGRLALSYYFPQSRFAELPALDRSVKKFIDSLLPKEEH